MRQPPDNALVPASNVLPSLRPSVALALGGGGARGLAHLLMLEAFDELGIRPKVIAGTSIGAIFAVAYASGLSAREIRAHVEEVLSQRRLALARELFAAGGQRVSRFWQVLSARAALLDPAAVLDFMLPSRVARDFAELEIPLKVVATDFYEQEAAIFTSGDLRRAVAASMALPVIFQPIMVNGRALIDGGLVNPLPFDLLAGEADIVVAVDVAGAPVPAVHRDHPSAPEALFASAFIFERSIIREKLKAMQPDIYVPTNLGRFQVLDFLKYRDILATAQPAKAALKAELARAIGAEMPADATVPPLTELAASPPLVKPPRRRLLRRSRRISGG
jgi:NTE family protein